MGTATQSLNPVLIGGQWRAAQSLGAFHVVNPATREPLSGEYPISSWQDCSDALDAAVAAFVKLGELGPEPIAAFLENYAALIEKHSTSLVAQANLETALPIAPRLKDVELPRTVNQLRQAATAAREESWRLPTIDTKLNIRSYLAPMGPVVVFGPNNFPLAFNGIAGGDYAAAIAAGNPVIAKAHPLHAGTTRLLAELAQQAANKVGLPAGTIQMIYKLEREDGCRLVADPRIAATAFTGGRATGLQLKSAADAAGKLIYLELSSINPVVILPGALAERPAEIAQEFTTSCLMGTGQFCTTPGLVVLLSGDATERFIADVTQRFTAAPVGVLLSGEVASSLTHSVQVLQEAGAKVLTSDLQSCPPGYCVPNTLLRVSGRKFLENSHALQTEAFGNASLLVVANDLAEAMAILECLEGNLTGTIYSHSDGREDREYESVASALRQRVGRLLNDKMPTGVAVSPAMNHGGPYPATGHPHFTAVGIPAAIRRFTMLQCFDNVRSNRLPPLLRNENPNQHAWRCIDGNWTQADAAPVPGS